MKKGSKNMSEHRGKNLLQYVRQVTIRYYAIFFLDFVLFALSAFENVIPHSK